MPIIPTFAEAALELARARIATKFWIKTVFDPLPPVRRTGPKPDTMIAEDLGAEVIRAACAMPFRAVCLQQALALRRMLHRRGISSVLRLGMAPDRVDDAHAWLIVDGRIVSGKEGVERFHTVAEFP